MIPTFKRVAIVNRGEPALRLLHAVRELNEEFGAELRTIAFYTEPDRESAYVKQADEALCLGPASFIDAQSEQRKSTYLNYPLLHQALVSSRAQAAWVGWGFVSEQPAFAQLCRDLGVVFIGPEPEVMRRLGDKIAAKRLAERVGLATIPWSREKVSALSQAKAQAARLGYPVLLKAAHGGGGRGIRLVQEEASLEEALDWAQAEALRYFGDSSVFLEKSLAQARHVEVQIVADRYGNCWPVGLRDCTLQRRHQKLLEEAPVPALPEGTQREMLSGAERFSREAGYHTVGTVEFLWQPTEQAFYFLEMNPRLQVEHPVTELTTGLDLVKLQLALASGHRLEGSPPQSRGHAVEVRLNAEDPYQHFAPCPGQLQCLDLPQGPGIRVDSGVEKGDQISPEFDSMLAKIIAYGKDRNEALARARRALLECTVVLSGGTTNKHALLELLDQPEVRLNSYDTAWFDRAWDQRSQRAKPLASVALVQASLDIYNQLSAQEQALFYASAARGRPALRSEVGHKVELRYGGHNYQLEVRQLAPKRYRLSCAGQSFEVQLDRQGPYAQWLTCFGQRHHIVSTHEGFEHRVEVDGVLHRIHQDQAQAVCAPAPAVVLGLLAQPNQQVKRGERLVLLEAMKTEMAVTAPYDGRVRDVLVLPNSQVGPGTPLLLLEPLTLTDEQPAVDRLQFPAEPTDTPISSGRLAMRQLLSELKYLLLGFDIDADAAKRLLKTRASVCAQLPQEDLELWALEDEVLSTFSDIQMLYRRESETDSERAISSEEYFHTYLRSVASGTGQLPASFVEKLQRALQHYGVQSLEPNAKLEHALFHIHKSSVRMEQHAEHVFGVLQRRLEHIEQLQPLASQSFGALLDRVILATNGLYTPLNDLAREVRYRFYERPVFARAREAIYQQVQRNVDRLSEQPDGPDRDELIQALVECPQPILGYVSSILAGSDVAARRLCVEIMVRRLFRIRDLRNIQSQESLGYSVAQADFIHNNRYQRVLATHASYPHLAQALSALEPLLRLTEAETPVTVELYAVGTEEQFDSEQTRTDISELLRRIKLGPSVQQLCVSLSTPGRWSKVQYLTYLRDGAEGFQEHRVHPGIHPMLAERLELWRLQNFGTRQLRAADDIYLFHAVARDNPKDERLFAFVEIRDLTPIRNDQGEIVQLPHLERMFQEAVANIRDFQARRPARDRLQWNRVMLYVWPPADVTPQEMRRIAQRLGPVTKHLGLEKAVLRLRLRDQATGQLQDTVVHVSNRVGTGLLLHSEAISDKPIRPLSAYAQKVVQMRRLGLLYPYEIIRMLTPEAQSDQGEFPPGEFTEYDLDPQGQRLVPVARAVGKNTTNVVVGVIRNFTSKHPEGMKRVILLSDASREMGALAEPECLRVLRAIDLAKELRVPLEWFPVSSGAKIAMDVGTEGLDWVGRVLRRIIQFTQSGGEINIVVSGVNVGGQSYWNAEATMLMHTRGILVMTPQASMVLTGKRALDYSGGVSAEDNQGIGGVERIMGFNGQAQYAARDMAEACHILFRHYEHTYVAPGERFPRNAPSLDPETRDVGESPLEHTADTGLTLVRDIFSAEKNGGRKKPFDIRSVMRATVDQDHTPLERWALMRNAENSVVWDAHLGGTPVCLIGIESRPLPRLGFVPADGPETWTGGTLFPLSSKKTARAINAASNNRPVVVLANLSGFDGSPESMRNLQLEYGSEIGRAVVNFEGPIVFCVISRYHGGAYVVFSRTLNENVEVAALEGSYASVIGGAPAAAVVFPGEVKTRTLADERVKAAQELLNKAQDRDKPRALAHYNRVFKTVFAEKQGEVADYFDSVHSVQRAQQVGSLQTLLPAPQLRPYLIDAVRRGMQRTGTLPQKG